jgi:lipoprotein NlpI
MKFSRIAASSPAIAGTLAGMLFMLEGCTGADPQTRIVFANATINERRAKLLLDTGSPDMWLFQASAGRLGLGSSADYTPPARLSVGANITTTEIPIHHEEWYARWAVSGDYEGIVGWLDVRENILVFDADRHVVYPVPELPTAAHRWLKLKISPADSQILMLEIPQPDGSTGKVLVDTGSPFGVSLTPAQWQKWRQDHPDAPSTSRLFKIAGSTVGDRTEAWADEISLGPLSFTDVPVHEATVNEIEMTGNKTYAGTLGMYALERMDLVVDGRSGFAYVRLRPPPGPPYPGIARPGAKSVTGQNREAGENWSVTGAVNLVLDRELVFVADREFEHKGFRAAIRDCTLALEADPHNPHAYFTRGIALSMTGDIAGALADLGECIRLDPALPAAYLNRGIIEERRGDFPGSLADCTECLALDARNGTAYFVRGMDRQSLGDFSNAAADYEKAAALNTSQPDRSQLYCHLMQLKIGAAPHLRSGGPAGWTTDWDRSLNEFIIGLMDEASLLATAKKLHVETVSSQECEAYYFIGEMHLVRRDESGARAFFEKCLGTGQKDHTEYRWARAELTRLDEK